MQFSWLRSFHHMAEFGSISMAAKHLRVAPSAISKQIKDLEHHYNLQLVIRTGNGMKLTHLGASLKAETDKLFKAEKSVKSFLNKAQNRVTEVLNIGAENISLLIPLVNQLRIEYPKEHYRIYIDNNVALRNMLTKNKVDIALLYEPRDNQPNDVPPDLFRSRISSEKLRFVQSVNSPFITDKNISIAELLVREPIIVRTPESLTRGTFDQLCNSLKIDPNIFIEVSTRTGVIEAVSEGLGIGVIFGKASERLSDVSEIKPTHDSDLRSRFKIDLYLYCHQSLVRSKIIDRIISFMRSSKIKP